MGNKKSNSSTISWKKIFSSLMIVVVTVAAFWIYSDILGNYLKEESLNRLTEVAQVNKTTISRELREKQETLFQISHFVEDEQDMSSAKIMEHFKSICKNNYFKRIGIVYPNKEIYIMDNLGKQAVSVENIKAYFDEAMQGKTAIVRIYKDGIDGKDSLIFSRPLYNDNNEIKGVLFASYDIKILQRLLTLTLFDGTGYSVVIDKDGQRIVAGLNAIEIKNDSKNVFINLDEINADNKPVLDEVKNDLLAGNSGLVKITAYEPMYLYYQPLGINDMSLLTIIPRAVIDTRYDMLMRNTYILSAVLLMLVVVIVINIVLDERKKKRQLENILYKDKVTGGYSFEKFCLDVETWLKISSTKKAFISFDIDNFKLINDIFGYEIGNIILADIWKVLQKNVKNGIITRPYADNFLMVVEFKEKKDLVMLMENIVRDIKKITTIKIDKFRIIASMGIYIIEDDEKSIDYMQNCAMMARRIVKDKYDTFYSFYYKGMKDALIEKKKIMDDILQALALKEFQVYYQPKYDAKTQRMVGSEALIRWIKNGKIFISPAKFIPIAEEVGSIIDIDKYIFEMVCRHQSEWKKRGLKILPVSVNVSRNRLYRPNFIEEYVRILNKYDLATENIQFEITEGNLVSKRKIGEQIVDNIRKAGFDVLIDDFGTGYSSISMIRDINATEMKIDKSFIDDMSIKGKAMVQHVIKIAKTVDMKTVAEGVETKEQYEFLRDNDCDIIQGYYFARPIPAKEYETYLEKNV